MTLLLRIAGFLLLSALPGLASAPARADVWLWAWDRPEDLRWIPAGTGVAYFAAEFVAAGSRFDATGRRAALRVRPDTPLLAVLHIEAFDVRHPPILDAAAVERWADGLHRAIRRLGVSAAQIDFEARAGQQAFYADVLRALRARLPQEFRLSATALASWCGDPAWLDALPLDEVVPMYFRMGTAERDLWRRRMLDPDQLPAAACRRAAGIATDEWRSFAGDRPDPAFTRFRGRRLYVFSPSAWQADALRSLPDWSPGLPSPSTP
ncbi:MAG: hypothetical protein AMXMBFR59_20430 [Rhodanobacteraceae bacterium]